MRDFDKMISALAIERDKALKRLREEARKDPRGALVYRRGLEYQLEDVQRKLSVLDEAGVSQAAYRGLNGRALAVETGAIQSMSREEVQRDLDAVREQIAEQSKDQGE
jgi:hypothetical protein